MQHKMNNALDAQIAYLARHSVEFSFPKIVTFLNIMSWLFAACCVCLAVAVLMLARGEIKPFAVTQTGLVVSIKPIDGKVMESLLEKAKPGSN